MKTILLGFLLGCGWMLATVVLRSVFFAAKRKVSEYTITKKPVTE